MLGRLSRREFLRLASVAAGGLVLPPPAGGRSDPSGREGSGRRIVVVGAGLAGLATALELRERGFQVTVLEARLRPGGRVWTLREPFADGLHAEAGAARIQGRHQRVRRWTERFGLELDPFLPQEGDVVDLMRGRRVRRPLGAPRDPELYPVELTPEERDLGPSGLFAHYLRDPVGALGDVTAPGWPPDRLARYDERTLRELFADLGASPDVVDLLVLGAFDPEEDFSALYLLWLIALGVGAPPLFKIRGGNDRLPEALARELASDVRYGAVVERIECGEPGETDGGAVRALYRSPQGAGAVAADRLVLAIPYSVLRRVEIAPALSPEKDRAIREMVWEPSARVTLQVRERPWEREGLAGFGRTDAPSEIWHPTHDRPGERGLLQAYVKGGAGGRLAGLPEAERLSWTAGHVDQVLPGTAELVEGGVAVCWGEEEFSRGAYPVYETGQMTGLYPHVARPEGRLHFAGDHTSGLPGWMEGALESAERVVEEVTGDRVPSPASGVGL